MKRLLPFAIALFLVGAGCAWNPFAQIPVAPPAVPSVPVAPTPAPESATSTTSTSDTHTQGWSTFSYGAPVFNFSYPPEAASTTADTDDVFALGLGSRVQSTTAKSIPRSELHVKVLSPSSPEMKDCFYSMGRWPTGMTNGIEMQHLKMDTREFCVTKEEDAAMGARRSFTNYATAVGDRVVVLSFFVDWHDCAFYEHPEVDCVAFDPARDEARFLDVVHSFKGAAGNKVGVLDFVTEAKTSSSKGLAIDVEYPHLATSAAASNFNQLIDARIGAIVDQFKKDYESAQKEVRQPPLDMSWTLSMDYTVHRHDDHRFTIVESGSMYTGGAHPNAVYLTVSFDAKTQQEVHLADLFAPKTDYLKEVSAASVAALTTRNGEQQFSDADWIKSGAGPDIKNFQYFYFADGGALGIIFPPYQVAAYAAGPQEIEIASSTLKGLLP